MNVEKIVRKDVAALRADEAIDIAWRQMRDHQLAALPVTDSTDHLLGLLTEHDLLARLAPRRAPAGGASSPVRQTSSPLTTSRR